MTPAMSYFSAAKKALARVDMVSIEGWDTGYIIRRRISRVVLSSGRSIEGGLAVSRSEVGVFVPG